MSQIYFWDHDRTLSVRIVNNGLGPLLIDQISFIKGGLLDASIKNCLDLDPKSYMHVSMDDMLERVILPNAHLTIFETQFDEHENENEIDYARTQLAPITLNVEGRDIYDNKITLKRDFHWFSRYIAENETKQ